MSTAARSDGGGRRVGDQVWLAVGLVPYVALAMARWARWQTSGFDLGIFDQVVRHYARFQAPVSTLKGAGYLILGDHFSPLLAILAPTYWVFDDPRVLLVDQVLLVGASAWLLRRIAARRMDSGSARLLMFAYLFGPSIQTLVHYDFHEVCLGLPLVMLIVDAVDRSRSWQLAAAAFLLTLVREDMGVVVALYGVALLATRHPRPRHARWLGFGCIAGGLAMFALATCVVIPHFNASGYGYWDYGQLGGSPAAVVRNVVTHPWRPVVLLCDPPIKLLTIALLVVPVGFAALRSWYCVPAFAVLASRLLSTRALLWGPFFHYDAIEWAILFAAAALVVPEVSSGRWVKTIAALTGAAIVGCLVTYPRAVPLYNLFTPSFVLPQASDADRERAVGLVPEHVCVVADDHLVPRLTHRDVVARDFTALPGASWLLVDTSDTAGPAPQQLIAQGKRRGLTSVATFGSVHVYRSELPDAPCSP